MSDFDKEAEREKLREKYGDEDEERAATQQMSELLLQGATMTNKHCEECGDPVFRHEGNEFCPTCGTERGGGQTQRSDAGGQDTDRQAAPSGGPGSDASTDPDRSDDRTEAPANATADRTGAPTNATTDRTEPPADATADRTEVPTDATADRGARDRGESDRVPSSRPAPDERGPALEASAGAGGSTAEGIGAAQASLAQTVEEFARRAEATDDPRAAREHLAAAREAAEALSALRR